MKGLVASRRHGEQMAAPAFILFVLAVGLGHLASQRSLRLGRKGLGPRAHSRGKQQLSWCLGAVQL